MEIHAYDYDYVSGAQRILGDAADFAIITLGVEPNVFGDALSVADAGRQFALGNPKYVAGMNGCEFARIILDQTKTSYSDKEDAMFVDKSPEFWAGWALAFYQWYKGYSFMEILDAVSFDSIIDMYPIYHEMDIMQFVDSIEISMQKNNPQTKLKKRREICGLSQSELSADSDVPLRQIQLFEQRQRDINKTAADTLRRLSKALNCRMEDLMELRA